MTLDLFNIIIIIVSKRFVEVYNVLRDSWRSLDCQNNAIFPFPRYYRTGVYQIGMHLRRPTLYHWPWRIPSSLIGKSLCTQLDNTFNLEVTIILRTYNTILGNGKKKRKLEQKQNPRRLFTSGHRVKHIITVS